MTNLLYRNPPAIPITHNPAKQRALHETQAHATGHLETVTVMKGGAHMITMMSPAENPGLPEGRGPQIALPTMSNR